MKSKERQEALSVSMEAEVARRIRQHGRSSMKAEVCGVLIGREEGRRTFVDACIPGVNAAQGGAHVTFTQETWEHIYQVKDKEFPDARIVGWYHSHPGFGVFLSDHDLFIQQNFFSSPQQIAWVYDPHSDEEGCFGWRDGEIKKIDDVRLSYLEPLGDVASHAVDTDEEVTPAAPAERKQEMSWFEIFSSGVLYAVMFAAGGVATFWYLDRQAVMVPRGAFEEIVYRVAWLEEAVKRCSSQGAPAPPSSVPPQGGQKNGTK
jgi:proteasome lid subunit RPN8/RPN11